MAPLNPEAPLFIPHHRNNHHHHHLQGKMLPLPTQHCFFTLSSCRHYFVHHPHTTATLPFSRPSSFPFHLTPQSHAEAEEFQQQNELDNGHDSQGFMNQRRVFKIIRCRGRKKEWRKKGEEEDEEGEVETEKIFPLSSIHEDHHYQQHYLHFPKNKQRFPLKPVRRGGYETTVMIRNIPGKYTRHMLVEFLENHCLQENGRGQSNGVGNENGAKNVLAFDCVYLPIDFRTGMNKGYAFVNFTKSEAAWKFRMTASHMRWDLFQSQKIREIVAARLQGKEKLEKHFGSMVFPCQFEEVLPVVFSPPRDGVLKGEMRTIGSLVWP